MDWMDFGWRICLFDVFLDGLGWVHGFWMTPEWILMVLVCMRGWFLDGFLMVLAGFWMNVGWICDGRCMEFFYVFLIV